MATTMVQEPASSPSPSPSPSSLRFVAIRANLLPDEIVTARAALAMRKQVIAGLVVVVALLIAWFGLSWWQTNSAQSDLDNLQGRGTALQNQTQQFAPLVKAQGDTAAIQTQLQKLMVGDLSWTGMLSTLRAKAPSGIAFTQVTGTITSGAAGAAGSSGTAAGGYDALNRTGREQIGSITITGTSNDKRSIADFADKLSAVKGLTAPYITSVASTGKTVTFSITALITSDALGGRYAAPAPAAAAQTPGVK